MRAPAAIEAAGGLLWRPGEHGIEVGLVHRPKYDDWSLPKGKLEPGEHPLLAALREVEEEAGARVVAGRPLGQARYDVDGRPKRVQYWSLRWARGEFTPNAEVDVIDWVPAEKAADRVSQDRDGVIVEEFLRETRPTRACVVLRHARAGSRARWKGRDTDRPLDEAGREQARVLADLLAAFAVTRACSADVQRCLDTLAPFEEAAGLTVERESLFSDSSYPAHPEMAAARAIEIVGVAGGAAICTQGGALPGLIVEMCHRLGTKAKGLRPMRKGSLVVMHLTQDEPTRVVAVEQLPAPA